MGRKLSDKQNRKFVPIIPNNPLSLSYGWVVRDHIVLMFRSDVAKMGFPKSVSIIDTLSMKSELIITLCG